MECEELLFLYGPMEQEQKQPAKDLRRTHTQTYTHTWHKNKLLLYED